jgi:hypothetical protein
MWKSGIRVAQRRDTKHTPMTTNSGWQGWGVPLVFQGGADLNLFDAELKF